MSSYKEREVPVGNREINQKALVGKAKDCAILILHGWGGSSKSWTRIKELLENQGYKIYIPDLPGFGGNPAPQTPWSVDDYVDWVNNFCEKQGLSRFFLLGHSFGGALAVKIAAKAPEKIEKLILVAPALKRDRTIKYYFYLILAKIGKPIFSLPILSFLLPIAQRVLYKIEGTSDYHKLEIEKAVMMKETFKKIVAEDLRFCLPLIKNKTLILWGKKDVLTPFGDSREVNEKISGSQLEVFENEGHSLNLAVPEKLTGIILKFLV